MPSRGAKLSRVSIKGYRSIDDEGVEISVPKTRPLVLIGENNAGKSNILQAFSVVIGENWMGNHDPEDHEFFGRSPEGRSISIQAFVEGMSCPRCPGSQVSSINWKINGNSGERPDYSYTSDCTHSWMSGEIKSYLSCVMIGTDRGLDYQLSYKSRWTTLSKLMRGFHSSLVSDEYRVAKLKSYHDSLLEIFNEVDEFRMFSKSLSDYAKDFGGNMPYGLDISFSSYDPSNFYQSLRLSPFLDGEARAFDELGTGQSQILAIAFAYAYSRAFGSQGLVLLIEEPESHLHPLAQEWFSSRIANLVQSGCQVVVSTHSPYFIDLSVPGSYAVVRKASESSPTRVTQLRADELCSRLLEMGAPQDKVNSANVGEFYERSATTDIKAGLFSRGVILVEGASEKYGIAVLLKRVGLDTVKEGFAIVPVEGVNNMAKWVRFFRAHQIPVFAIFDSDSKKTGSDARSARSARRDIFTSLSLSPDLDWDERDPSEDSGMGFYAVLNSDYEDWMKSTFGETYSRLDEAARELFGPSKPLRARWCAVELGSPESHPDRSAGWDIVENLANSIALGLKRQLV